jgi:adenylate kinase family enzyme
VSDVTKVAIIGNGGGGKSVLSRRLSDVTGLPVHEIDDLQWEQPGWVAVPPEVVRERHDRILADRRWIIDGWGPWESIEQRFGEADTIIVVDLPLARHYWWATKRALRTRRYPLVRLYRAMWFVHRQGMPRVRAAVADARQATVIWLRSPADIQALLAEAAAA